MPQKLGTCRGWPVLLALLQLLAQSATSQAPTGNDQQFNTPGVSTPATPIDVSALPQWHDAAAYFGAASSAAELSANSTGPPYSVDGSGNCEFGALPIAAWPFQNVAALSLTSPLRTTLPQMACGICLLVQCTDNTPGACNSASTSGIVVQVVDACDGCGSTGLNLQHNAFNNLTGYSVLGHANITYKQVACAPPGNLIIHIIAITNTANGYIKLAFKNVAGLNDITTVEIVRSGLQGTPATMGARQEIWRVLDNLSGAAWEYSGLPSDAPALDVRVTNSQGQQLNIRGAIPANVTSPGDFLTTMQFQS